MSCGAILQKCTDIKGVMN